MKLFDAIVGDANRKDFKIGNAVFVLKTLTQRELNEVMLRVTRADITMLELQKIPILARSIISINGVPIEATDEVRQELDKNPGIDPKIAIENVLGNLDSTMLSILYGKYEDLRDETYQKRLELKNG